MKKLAALVILIGIFTLPGCYTVLMTTENSYEEELNRISEYKDDADFDGEVLYAADEKPNVIICYGDPSPGFYHYYAIPWWYLNPIVSEDNATISEGMRDLRDGGDRPSPSRIPRIDIPSVTSSGGGGTSGSTTTKRGEPKKNVTTDGNNSDTSKSSNKPKDDKKNLRNSDGNRSGDRGRR